MQTRFRSGHKVIGQARAHQQERQEAASLARAVDEAIDSSSSKWKGVRFMTRICSCWEAMS